METKIPMSNDPNFSQSNDPQQVLDQIRAFLGISESDDERVREIILDFHAILERSLQEIMYMQLSAQVLLDDRSDVLKQELREKISKLSFSSILDVLSPILISWYDNRPFLSMQQEDEYHRLIDAGLTKGAESYRNENGLKSDIVTDLKAINALRNKAAHDPKKCKMIVDWRSDRDIKIINEFAFKCACLNMDLLKIIES